MFLHDILSLADSQILVIWFLHVVPQASHHSVTGIACCSRDIPNGWNSITQSKYQLLVTREHSAANIENF